MSERGGGTLGPFLLGVALGAALGALFAPDTGEVTRRQLGKKIRGLRDLAEDKADEFKALVAGDEDEEEDQDQDDGEGGDEDESAPRSARDELEQRLADARRRRRQASKARDAEEDDQLA